MTELTRAEQQSRESQDWTAADALRILALPLDRYTHCNEYGGVEPDDWKESVYSNGTQAEYAYARAERVLDNGPVLRKVLEAGVRALADDKQVQHYIYGLYAGDEDAIVGPERELRR